MQTPAVHGGHPVTRAALVTGAAAVLIGLAWHWIAVPYRNPLEIIGPLSRAEFHPVSNLLRYVVFVGVPVVFAVIMLAGRAPGRCVDRVEEAFSRQAFLLVALVAAWGALQALLQWADPWIPPPDLLHFGEILTPAMTYWDGGGIWTGSFFEHGAFYDVFASVTGWWWAAEQSAQAAMKVQTILHGLWAPGLAVLLVAVFAACRSEFGEAAAAVLVMALLGVAYLSQRFWSVLTPRDVLPLLGFGLMVTAEVRRSSGLWLLVGLLAPAALFYSIDRGSYLTMISLAVLAAGMLAEPARRRRFRWAIIPWCVGLGTGAAAWLLLFGRRETGAFVENFLFWARYKDYLDSYVYPSPLDFGAPFQAGTLWLILAAAFLLVVAWPAYRGSPRRGARALHVCLVIAAIVFMRSGLGRSDPQHVLYSSPFAWMAIGYGVWRLVAARIRQPQVMTISLAVLAVLVASQVVNLGLARWAAPGVRQQMFERAGRDELVLLPEKARLAAPRLRRLFSDEPCLFMLPSEPAWYFHLRKRPCSRFYLTWFAAPRQRQQEVMHTLERLQPHRILYASPLWSNAVDGIGPQERFPYLVDYIQRKYEPLEAVEGFIVYRRRSQP